MGKAVLFFRITCAIIVVGMGVLTTQYLIKLNPDNWHILLNEKYNFSAKYPDASTSISLQNTCPKKVLPGPEQYWAVSFVNKKNSGDCFITGDPKTINVILRTTQDGIGLPNVIKQKIRRTVTIGAQTVPLIEGTYRRASNSKLNNFAAVVFQAHGYYYNLYMFAGNGRIHQKTFDVFVDSFQLL